MLTSQRPPWWSMPLTSSTLTCSAIWLLQRAPGLQYVLPTISHCLLALRPLNHYLESTGEPRRWGRVWRARWKWSWEVQGGLSGRRCLWTQSAPSQYSSPHKVCALFLIRITVHWPQFKRFFFVSRLIETRLVTLNTQLRNLKQPSANASTRHVLSTLYEDIHWLLLVAGRLWLPHAECICMPGLLHVSPPLLRSCVDRGSWGRDPHDPISHNALLCWSLQIHRHPNHAGFSGFYNQRSCCPKWKWPSGRPGCQVDIKLVLSPPCFHFAEYTNTGSFLTSNTDCLWLSYACVRWSHQPLKLVSWVMSVQRSQPPWCGSSDDGQKRISSLMNPTIHRYCYIICFTGSNTLSYFLGTGFCILVLPWLLHLIWCLFQMSLSLTSSFGQDSEGGQWTLNFLLDKIVSNIQAWSSEPGLMEDTLNLFLAMVEKRAMYVPLPFIVVQYWDKLLLFSFPTLSEWYSFFCIQLQTLGQVSSFVVIGQRFCCQSPPLWCPACLCQEEVVPNPCHGWVWNIWGWWK